MKKFKNTISLRKRKEEKGAKKENSEYLNEKEGKKTRVKNLAN